MMFSNIGWSRITSLHHKNPHHDDPPERHLLPLLEKVKSAYLLWYGFYSILPKTHRHSLGVRIDSLFVEIIEYVSMAAFLSRDEKLPYVRLSIRKLETLSILLMILWETKSIDTKRYISLSIPLQGLGKMLGGWKGQLEKASFAKAP